MELAIPEALPNQLPNATGLSQAAPLAGSQYTWYTSLPYNVANALDTHHAVSIPLSLNIYIYTDVEQYTQSNLKQLR